MKITLRKTVLPVTLSTLVLFAILEGIFRVFGSAPGADSFVEKIIMQEHLEHQKPNGEFRIFTYGESIMHGAQYGPTSSPARWLEAYLEDFLPGKDIRVVNFARLGRGSNFTYHTFRDTLFYQPDMAIFYTGHNSFLPGERKDQIDFKDKNWVYLIRSSILKSRFIAFVYKKCIRRQINIRAKRMEDRMGHEIIETSPRNSVKLTEPVLKTDPFYRENLAFFQQNIEKIIKLAEQHDVRLIFLEPVSNLKDFPPIKSAHFQRLTPEELNAWNESFETGKKAEVENRLTEALNNYKEAYIIDNEYAELSYRMGQIYFRNGDFLKAHALFEEARDNDTVIVRATTDTIRILERLAGDPSDIGFLNTEKAIAPAVTGGILGEPIIEDNVHFSIKGHALVARAIAQEIADRNWIAPKERWQFEREETDSKISEKLGVTNELLLTAYLKVADYYGDRFDARLQTIRKAMEIDPSDMRVLRALAWTYWLMGEEEKAFEVYRKIEEANPQVLHEIFERQPELKNEYISNPLKALKIRKRSALRNPATTAPPPIL